MIEKWIQKSHNQKTGKGKEKALPKCPFSSKQKDGIRQGNTELLTVVSTHDVKGVKLFYGVHVMINGWYSGCS